MKMKGFWKKVIAKVLTAVMLVSVFSIVDMGWNVMEVKAADGEDIYVISSFTINTEHKIDPISLHSAYFSNYKGNIKITPLEYDESAYYYRDDSNGKGLRAKGIKQIKVEFEPNQGYGLTKMEVQGYISSNAEYITLNGNGPWTINLVNDKYQLGGKEYDTIRGFKVSYHSHSFTAQSATATYLKSATTCTAAAVYYYKCAGCNEKGTKTYSSGSALGHAFNQYSKSGNSIIVKCQRNSACGQQLTYTLDPKDCKNKIPYTNRGSYTAATFIKTGTGTPSVGEPTVKYKGVNGTNYSDSTTKPSNTGSYQAYITMGSQTVSCDFSIAPGGDIYKFDGGDSGIGSMPDQVVLKDSFVAGTKLNKNLFQRIGYAFLKWISDISGLEFKDEAELSMPDLTNPKTHTLTAQWKPNDYTLTFNNSGADIDTGTETKIATYDATLPSITIPEKSCSEFQGYYTAANGGGTRVYDKNGKDLLPKWTTPNDITLYAHWSINHDWGYEAVDNQVIATCKNGCGTTKTLTLDAPDSVYNKSAYDVASVTNDAEFPIQKTIADIWYEGTSSVGTDYKNKTAPTNAGTYKATVTVNDGEHDYTAEKSFIIDKADQNATASVSDFSWGTTDPIPTPMLSGADENPTPSFYFNETNSNTGGTQWKDFSFETKDAGTYYVYAEYTETSNYKEGKTSASPFKVTGKTIEGEVITANSYSGEYDKQPHSITVTINDENPGAYTVTYATASDGIFTVSNPTFTNAGNYTVYYKVKKFGYEVANGNETVNITPKAITITPNSDQSKSYGESDPVIIYTYSPDLCTGDVFIGGLTYTDAAVNANVGTYSIEMGTLSAGDNYTLTLVTETFEITKATYTKGPEQGVGYTIDYVAETLALEPTSAADFEIGKKEGETISPITADSESLTPGDTDQSDLYFIRHKANSNQESSDWTAITIPARPAAPNAVDKQETVMNKKDAEVTGVSSTMEYQFDGADWTTVSDGTTKIPNPENKNIKIRVKASNENENFRGIEKEIEFVASDIMLEVRMGQTVVKVPYNGTVSKDQRPTDPVSPDEKLHFMYWAFGGSRWKFDGESDTPDKVTRNITLTAVYGIEISGIITAKDYDSITKVSLVDGKGNSFEAKVEPVDESKGTHRYSVIAPAGVDYNLVIEGVKKIDNKNNDITKTQLINLNKEGGGDAIMPAGVFSSKVNKDGAGENYKNTLVGGLDEIADKIGEQNQSSVVVIELKVSATVKDDDKSKIQTAKTEKTLDFVDLTLEKTINNGTAVNIGSSNTELLQIIIPYETADKYSIEVYRYHVSAVETLTTTANADGEKIVVGPDTVTIHAKKFSTYAIGYSNTPPATPPTTPPANGNTSSSGGSDSSDSSGSSGSSVKKPAVYDDKKRITGIVYRAYNKNDGDHLYTTSYEEFLRAVRAGWADEGYAFMTVDSNDKNAIPVYRVYNPNSGEHFFTINAAEKDNTVKAGWRYEGIAFYVYRMDYSGSDAVNVYRLFNPNVKGDQAGSHHYTIGLDEYNAVVAAGWRGEGAVFKALPIPKE